MPVSISGIGAKCALGDDVSEITYSLYNTPPYPASPKALHPQALPYPFYSAKISERHNSTRDTLSLALNAAEEAMTMAGWTDLTDAGVIVGTTSGTALYILESHREKSIKEDLRDYLSCNPALAIGKKFKASGPCLTISNACVSGGDAIGLGMDLIESGQVDKVLCGGADAFSFVAHTGFARLKISAEERCRPFEKDRTGLNLGEGAAFMCLEKNPSKTIGRVLGYGSCADAWNLTAPHPEGRGLKKAIAAALSQSGISMTDLAFINAHGTGTKTNDQIEGSVIKDFRPDVPVWASKIQTGHTLGAAGALEAVLTLIALNQGRLPNAGSENFEPDPRFDTLEVNKDRRLSKKIAMSLSLGFGGGNTALILEACK